MQTELKFKIDADPSGMQQGIGQATTALNALGQKAGAVGTQGATASGAFASSIESLGRSVSNFVSNPLGAMQSGLTGLLGKIGPMAIGIGSIAGAAVLAGKAIWDLGAAAADEVEHLENLSAQTGLSTQKLQALAQIAKEAGLESLDLGRSIGMLQAQLGEGKGDFIDALEKMNITMIDLVTGKPKDAITLLDEMREKLLAITDPTERAQAAQDALGGRLRELIPLLLNSKDSLGNMTAELEKSGVVYDEITKNKLKKFDDAMDKLGRTWTSTMTTIKGSIGSVLGPVLEWLGKDIDKLNAEVDKLDKAKPKIDQTKTSTENLGKAMDETAGFTKFIAISTEKWAEINKVATGSVKKHTDEIKRLKEETQNALSPLDALAKKIQDQINLGFSKHQIVKLYADQILNASQKQYDLTGKLTDSERELAAMALLEKLVTERTKAMAEGVSLCADEWKDLGRELTSQKSALANLPLPVTIENVSLLDRYVGDLADSTDGLSGQLQKVGPELKNAGDASKGFGNEVSTIFTNMSQNIAKNIIEWKGWKETLINTGKSLAEAFLATMINKLFKPLIEEMSKLADNLVKQLTNLFSGKGFDWGSIFGSGSSQKNIGGTSIEDFVGPQQQGQSDKWSWGNSGEIVGIIALIAKAIDKWVSPLLVRLIGGRNAYEAGAMEIMRDFKVSMDISSVNKMFSSFGLTESQAYPIRKDIFSSPVALQQFGALAKEQGKYEEFLKSLEKVQTAWGAFDFRKAFELGADTGDWRELNKQFEDAFEHSEKLNEIMPDWREQLELSSDAATALANDLAKLTDAERAQYEGFSGLKNAMTELNAAYDQTISETSNKMYQDFLLTGEITDELRQKVTDLGGSIANFEAYSKIIKLGNTFAQARAEWEQDGTVMEGLSDIFKEAGINLSVLDDAALLPGLREGLSTLQSLAASIQSAFADLIPKTLSPIQEFIEKGIITDELITQLSSIIPDFLTSGLYTQMQAMADLIQKRNDLSGTLTEEGKAALDSINTKLSTMVPNILTEIGNAETNVQAKIAQYTSEMEAALDTAAAYIASTMATAREAVISDLDIIIDKILEVGQAVSEIGDTAGTTVGNNVITSVGTQIADILNNIGQYGVNPLYMGLGSSIAQYPIPAYASGTDYVPRSGIYHLDEGEGVLTRAQNRERNQLSVRGGDINLNLVIHSGGNKGDIVQEVKTQVIPILIREMNGGNTGLRDAVVSAYDRTARAY